MKRKLILGLITLVSMVLMSCSSAKAEVVGDTNGGNIDYYNLDVIISVGYRVKSKEGTKFRQWANKVLKEYMLKGYAVNQRRLEYLEKTIKLIDIANRIDERIVKNHIFADGN